MKLFREIILIFGIYYIGEFLTAFLNLPIPGNLVGMLLLFLLLCCNVVKLKQVSTVSDFLLSHLSFFFIPAGVGLMSNFSLIANAWFPIIIVCAITTIITMGVTGKVVQLIMKKGKK